MSGMIGSIPCFRVSGGLPLPKLRIETWAVPGIDGVGAQAMGYQDGEFSVLAVAYTNLMGLADWDEAIESTQGQIVRVLNDFGVIRPYCLITRVAPVEGSAALAAGGITVRGQKQISGIVLP